MSSMPAAAPPGAKHCISWDGDREELISLMRCLTVLNWNGDSVTAVPCLFSRGFRTIPSLWKTMCKINVPSLYPTNTEGYANALQLWNDKLWPAYGLQDQQEEPRRDFSQANHIWHNGNKYHINIPNKHASRCLQPPRVNAAPIKWDFNNARHNNLPLNYF